VTAHAEFLRAATSDELLAQRLKADFRQAGLPDRDRTMLEFVETLCRAPWALTPSRVDGLRRAGWRDEEILQVVLGSAHFNYLNRMADGLGVRLEYVSALPRFEPRGSRPAPGPRAFPPREGGLAWIAIPETLPGDTAQGQTSNLDRVLAGNPEVRVLASSWRAFQLRATPGLDGKTRARIALYVSSLEDCEYARRGYEELLHELGEDPAVVGALSRAEVPSRLPSRDRLFLEHAARLTREPWTTREERLRDLRSAGLDDRGILRLTMLISYLSFETRVALGLGVRLEAPPRLEAR